MDLRLVRFKVKNYKNFKKEITVNMEDLDGHLYLLYGGCGEGKTNLLSAILDGLTDFRFSKEDYFNNNFHNIKFTYVFEDTLTGTNVTYLKKFNSKRELKLLMIHKDNKCILDLPIKCQKDINKSKEHLRELNRFANNICYISDDKSNYDKNRVYDLLTNTSEFILKDIQKYLDTLGINIKIFKGEKGSVWINEYNNIVPLKQQYISKSLSYALQLYYGLVYNDLLLIDDFGNLDNTLCRNIVKYLKNRHHQFILVSNNTHLMSQKIIDFNSLHIIDKNIVAKLKLLGKKEIRQSHNIEKLYLAKHFL